MDVYSTRCVPLRIHCHNNQSHRHTHFEALVVWVLLIKNMFYFAKVVQAIPPLVYLILDWLASKGVNVKLITISMVLCIILKGQLRGWAIRPTLCDWQKGHATLFQCLPPLSKNLGFYARWMWCEKTFINLEKCSRLYSVLCVQLLITFLLNSFIHLFR